MSQPDRFWVNENAPRISISKPIEDWSVDMLAESASLLKDFAHIPLCSDYQWEVNEVWEKKMDLQVAVSAAWLRNELISSTSKERVRSWVW